MLEMVDLVFSDSLGNLLNLLPMLGEKMSILYQILDVKTEHELLASRCDPHRDDILLTKVGTTGIPVLVDTDRPFSIFVSVAQLRFSTELLDKFFLIYLLKSPLVQTQCRENTKGVGNKNWVMRDIANTLICIPPLAEQKRIQASLANVLKSI